MATPLEPGRDYYWENGRMVLTEAFLRQRGSCCDNGCRHCPYRAPAPPGDVPAPPDPDQEDCSPGDDNLS